MIKYSEMTPVQQWRYRLYYKQLSMAFILNDMELCKKIEEEYINDLEKPDSLIVKEYNIELKLEDLEKDFTHDNG